MFLVVFLFFCLLSFLLCCVGFLCFFFCFVVWNDRVNVNVFKKDMCLIYLVFSIIVLVLPLSAGMTTRCELCLRNCSVLLYAAFRCLFYFCLIKCFCDVFEFTANIVPFIRVFSERFGYVFFVFYPVFLIRFIRVEKFLTLVICVWNIVGSVSIGGVFNPFIVQCVFNIVWWWFVEFIN